MDEYVKDVKFVDGKGVEKTSIYWQFMVQDNVILDEVLHFKNSYRPPLPNPNQMCLNNAEKMALKYLGLEPVKNQKQLSDVQLRMYVAFQFLEFLRNTSAHRLDRLLWWLNHSANITGKGFNTKGMERVVQVRFPVILSHLQNQFYKLGRQSDISSDEFCN